MGFSALDVGVAVGTIGLCAIVVGTFLGGLLTQMRRARSARSGSAGSCRSSRTSATPRWRRWASTGPSCTAPPAFSTWHDRPGHRRLRRAAAAAHAEAVLRHAVRAALRASSRSRACWRARRRALLADAIGWRDFFIFTLVTGVPGMVMLYALRALGRARDHLPRGRSPRRGTCSRATLVMARAAVVGAVARGPQRGLFADARRDPRPPEREGFGWLESPAASRCRPAPAGDDAWSRWCRGGPPDRAGRGRRPGLPSSSARRLRHAGIAPPAVP